jgi:predicted PurR-regulated permease PerM
MINNEKLLDISWGTIFKIGIGIIAFYAIFLIKDILIWFFFALIISFLFEPGILFLQKLRISRILSVVFVYVAFFSLLGLTIYLTAPTFFAELQQFSQLFPQYFEKVAPTLRELGFSSFESMDSFIQSIGDMLRKASSDIFSAIAVFFGGLSSMIFILSIALFLSLEEKSAKEMIKLVSPRRYENYILSLWEKTQLKVSGWFASRVLSCLFVGVVFAISLYLFNVKYSLSLALLAGVANFVPIIGPVVSGLVAFVFVALDSWLKAIFVVVILVLIHQIEGNILSPILTKKFVGLPPVMVLLSLAVGAKLLGILGAILSAPVAAAIFEFRNDFIKKDKPKTIEVQEIKQET